MFSLKNVLIQTSILHSIVLVYVFGVAQSVRVKPGIHEPHLPVERSVTLVSSIAVEQTQSQQRHSTTIEKTSMMLHSTGS